MGAPVTDNTKMGRKAAPIRRKLHRLVRRIERTPPEGVRATSYGGKGFVSPRGWIGQRLYEFHLSPDNPETTGFRWHDAEQATSYVRALFNGRGATRKQLTIMEAFLTWIEPVITQHEAEVEIARRQQVSEASGHGADRYGMTLSAAQSVADDLPERIELDVPPADPEPSEAVSEPQDGIRIVHVQPARTGDAEIDAMNDGVRMLTPLEPEVRERVMNYLASRFQVVV